MSKRCKSMCALDVKFRSFGWNVINVDGHNFERAATAFDEAKNAVEFQLQLAHTHKARVYRFMSNAGWHGKAFQKHDEVLLR